MTADDGNTARLISQVFELFTGHWVSYLVCTTVKLNIMETMPEAPKTATSVLIAEKLQLNPEYTYRLMRAVCCAGILKEESYDQFSITEKGRLLRKDGQPSLRDAVLLEISPEHRSSWIHLPTVIKNGPSTTGVKEAFGCETFVGLLEKNSEYAQVFNGAMTCYSKMENEMVFKCFDFSQFSSIMDIGGGHGMLLASIYKNFPNFQGKVMDLDHVIKSSTILNEMNVSENISLVSGNFFTGEGLETCDLYIMKHIIHDWSDESCLLILKNILKFAKKSSKLLVCDFMVAEPGTKSTGAELFDMHMMVMTTGKERTKKEMKSLMADAGWNLINTINTPNPQFVLHEAQPL